jgi:hypothetical protein
MGGGGMSGNLSEFVKKHYPDSKSDLFAVFIERCGQMAKKNGFQAMITQHAWMFLTSFENLRIKLQNVDIVNMAHLGARAFEEIGGEVVQTVTFVIRHLHINDYIGTYCRLIEPTTQRGKEEMFLSETNRYVVKQDIFSKIPGSPVAYWASNRIINWFEHDSLDSFAKCCKGLDSGDNTRFLRLWYEVSFLRISFNSPSGKNIVWCPHIKGGTYRKWYGNYDFVLWWKDDGIDIRNHPASRPQSLQYSFRTGFSWSNISTGSFSARYIAGSCSFDSTGPMGFPEKNPLYFIGFLNSPVVSAFLTIIEPTMHYSVGSIKKIPLVFKEKDEIYPLTQKCISLSKTDWDSFETSWDFKRHPLI